MEKYERCSEYDRKKVPPIRSQSVARGSNVISNYWAAISCYANKLLHTQREILCCSGRSCLYSWKWTLAIHIYNRIFRFSAIAEFVQSVADIRRTLDTINSTEKRYFLASAAEIPESIAEVREILTKELGSIPFTGSLRDPESAQTMMRRLPDVHKQRIQHEVDHFKVLNFL